MKTGKRTKVQILINFDTNYGIKRIATNDSISEDCHGLRGSGLARPVTQIFRFRLVLLGTPPPSSDP